MTTKGSISRILRCAAICSLAGGGHSPALNEFAPSPVGVAAPIEWTAYGRDAGGSRFSPAAQITRENVSRLSVAWTYRSGDRWVDDRTGTCKGRFEATPLFVDGSLFFATPFGTVISLDAEQGTERWRFDPHTDLDEIGRAH